MNFNENFSVLHAIQDRVNDYPDDMDDAIRQAYGDLAGALFILYTLVEAKDVAYTIKQVDAVAMKLADKVGRR